MMEDPDALELAFFVQIVKHILIENVRFSLLPLGAGRSRGRFPEDVELGDELYAELAAF